MEGEDPKEEQVQDEDLKEADLDEGQEGNQWKNLRLKVHLQSSLNLTWRYLLQAGKVS